METFDCSGWIHITISDHSDVAFIKLQHHQDHIPYCPIDIPEDVKKYVNENLKLTPTQVSNLASVIRYILQWCDHSVMD